MCPTATGTATAGQYANRATVTASPDVEDPVPITDDDVSHYLGATPGLAIDKTVDHGTVHAGDTVTFTITVTNTGNVAVRDVVVTDARVPACNRTIDQLDPGQSASHQCQATVRDSLLNVATVAATDPAGATLGATDSANVEVTSGAPAAPTPAPEQGPTPAGPTTTQARGGLAFTGVELVWLLLAALAALAVGTGSLQTRRLARRRRR